MITVIFPQQFARILDGQLRQVAEGTDLREVLANICKTRESLKKVFFLGPSELSPFVGFAKVGDSQFYTSKMIDSLTLQPGDSVEVIMSIAGG